MMTERGTNILLEAVIGQSICGNDLESEMTRLVPVTKLYGSERATCSHRPEMKIHEIWYTTMFYVGQ